MNKFDAIVVGGGLIGGSIAFDLAAQNIRVALIDRQQPGREASWAAAGMLSPGPDSPETLPLVPLAKESLQMYPGFVRTIEEASELSVAFAQAGTFEIFGGPSGVADRDTLLSRYAELGLVAESISIDSARAVEPEINFDSRAVVWLPDEATVDPRLLVDATLAAARNRGVEILFGQTVNSILTESRRCTGVLAGGQKILAGQVVIAAGSFCGGIGKDPGGSDVDVLRYAPTRPVRGQMMAMRLPKLQLQKVLRSERGYIVPRADGRIIGGSTLENVGFTKENTPEGLRKIFEAVVELAPALKDAEIVETWSGLRPDTPDHLPIIGPTDIPGLLIATGHYRNGILLAPVTAKLIREWIVDGKTSLNAERFSPLRFSAVNSRATAERTFPAAS